MKKRSMLEAKVSTYALEQHDKQVQAAEETVAPTKDDVETAIEQLYHNDDISYFDI